MSANGSHSTAPVPVSAILARVCRELGKVETRLRDLDIAVGHLAAESSIAHSMFQQLQELDRVVQEVTGVRQFLDELGQRAPGEWAIDIKGANSAIGLEGLAAMLAMASHDPGRDCLSDCELFS